MATQVSWDKTSQVGHSRVSQQRLILKDKNDNNSELVVQVRSSGESRESVKKANSDVSSGNKGDDGPVEDDPLIYGMPQAS